MKSTDGFKEILEYRERKSEELRRAISFSEALALWLSELPKKEMPAPSAELGRP